MTDDEKREKVIRGLECCAKGSLSNCEECPYTGKGCSEHLCADALALLKEQEPQVMTIGDVYRDHDRVVWIECREYKSLIIAQYRGQASWHNGRFGKWERFVTMSFADDYMHRDSDKYGETWRCWTSRPTEQQMQEVPWEETDNG